MIVVPPEGADAGGYQSADAFPRVARPPTRWAAITLIAYFRVRGRIDPDALQVFNEGQRGGPYGYRHGWNVNAAVAWVIGSVAGVIANSTDSFTGPIAAWAGGIDLSVATSALAAACAYLALEHAHPSLRAR
jgi:cytosine/uracil/thiamine/allantoin permease